VAPTVSVDIMRREKSLAPAENRNPFRRSSNRSLVATQIDLSRLIIFV
jgi:hypothetical protein